MPSYFTRPAYVDNPDSQENVADDMGLYHSMYFAEGGEVGGDIGRLLGQLAGGYFFGPPGAMLGALGGEALGDLIGGLFAEGGAVHPDDARTAPMLPGGYFEELMRQRFLDQIMEEDLDAAADQMDLPRGRHELDAASPNPFFPAAMADLRFAGGGAVFDPEGDDYDYATAIASGGRPQESDNHWPSRDPRSGMMLKGRRHPTYMKGIEADRALGLEEFKGSDGRYYTAPVQRGYFAGGGLVKRIANAIRAYHGSPHDFDKFDTSKIGTGEGAQAYGHGLYFAESEPVAKSYRDNLAGYQFVKNASGPGKRPGQVAEWVYGDPHMSDEHIRSALKVLEPAATREQMSAWIAQGRQLVKEAGKQGRMYEVNIHEDPARFLDWDRPLTEQPSAAREILEEVPFLRRRMDQAATPIDASNPFAGASLPSVAGRDAYRWIGMADENPAGGAAFMPTFASSYLRDAGIPGIRYLDGLSRGAGEGTKNYVIFPGMEDLIEITRKYAEGGSVDGGVRLYSPNPDAPQSYGAADVTADVASPSLSPLEMLWRSLPPEVRQAYASGARYLADMSPPAAIRDAVESSGRMTRAALEGDPLEAAISGGETALNALGALPGFAAVRRIR